jgi:hypothetical protein
VLRHVFLVLVRFGTTLPLFSHRLPWEQAEHGGPRLAGRRRDVVGHLRTVCCAMFFWCWFALAPYGDPKTKNIMILMVTALNELGDIERAVAAGCDDFLSKPVNKLELTKRVENMLKLRHVTDENERLRRYIDDMEDTSGPQGES